MQVFKMLKSLILLILNYNWKILNQSAIKDKLADLLTELKGVKFMTTLVLKFKKIQSDDKTLYSSFDSNLIAEPIINESDIDDVFKSIHSTIISNFQKP